MTINVGRRVVDRAVRQYVAVGSNMDTSLVIPGNRPGDAPDAPYASVLPIEWTPTGISDTIYDVSDATYVTRQNIIGSYSVQWFRDGSYDKATEFLIWASGPDGQSAAEERGLTYFTTLTIRQLDEIVSEQWEERAGIDLSLGFTIEYRGEAFKLLTANSNIVYHVSDDLELEDDLDIDGGS